MALTSKVIREQIEQAEREAHEKVQQLRFDLDKAEREHNKLSALLHAADEIDKTGRS